MIKILGDRGMGKTTKLIEISNEKNIPILCFSSFKQHLILEKAKALGISIPRPLIYESAYGVDLKEDVLIDNVEDVLHYFFEGSGYNLKGYTVSTRDLGETLYDMNKRVQENGK